MKALAEQIDELDGVEIYGRVVGVRGLMVEVAGPLHAMSVGARVVIETGTGAHDPVRGGRLFRRQRAADAVRAARRRAARLPRRGVVGRGRRCGRRRPGSAAWSTPWASRSTARGRCRRARRPIRSATRRRRRMPASASARRSISACARSTPSSPAAAASAWASSPAPASASRCCCRCWRATSRPMSR